MSALGFNLHSHRRKKVEKKRTFTIAFIFVLGIVFANMPEALAQEATGLRQILGIRPDTYYSDVHLAATPKGSFITATVDDPSKLSSLGLKGVKKGDRVELLNLGDGKWKVKHLLTRNEVTYYGSPELAEMDFTPPDYGLKEVEGIDLKVGLGKLFGDTTYQIGGTVTYADPTIKPDELHFPISELEFPLDVYMASIEGSIGFADRWKVSASVKKNITDDAGRMKDSDWGVTFEDPPGSDTWWWWYGPKSLDIYSVSYAELDALILDINLRYMFFKRFFVGLGYIHQNFDYECSLIRQWSPSGLSGYDYTGTGGVDLKYEVTYSIPYFEVVFMGKATDNFTVELSLGYSPIVNVEDEDQHLLRSKVNEGDCDGTALLCSLEGRYDFTKNWFITLALDYRNIKTDGRSEASFFGVYDHTIDSKIESKQVYTALMAGYAF